MKEEHLEWIKIAEKDLLTAKTHDLVFLNKKCIERDKDFEKITKECIRLTNYGVNIRYPNFMDIIREDAEIALRDVKKIIDLINKKI